MVNWKLSPFTFAFMYDFTLITEGTLQIKLIKAHEVKNTLYEVGYNRDHAKTITSRYLKTTFKMENKMKG